MYYNVHCLVILSMGKTFNGFEPLSDVYYTNGIRTYREAFRTFKYVLCYEVTPINHMIISGELKRFKRHLFRKYITQGANKLYTMSEKEKV